MDSTLILTTITTLLLIKNNVEGTFIHPERHTLPVGLQSLDGSDTNGGCSQECLMGNICGRCAGNLQLNSTLVDGVYPRGTIDTAQPDWAMDFFTVNRNGNNLIRIGFNFGTGFILRGIELKLFNCETLGTAITNIKVYPSFAFPTFVPPSSGPVGTYETVASGLDCDSLTTIIIPTNSGMLTTFYFIEFSYSDMDSNTAIYLAEIRFSDELIVVSSEVVTSTSQILLSSTAVSSSQLPAVTSSTTVLSLLSSSSPMPAPSTYIGTPTSVPSANTPTSTFTPSIKPTPSTGIGSVVIPTSVPPVNTPTSTFTPSIKPTPSTDIGSVVAPTSVPPANTPTSTFTEPTLSTDIGSVVTPTSVPPANTPTSTFTPSIKPTASTDIGSVVTPTSVPPANTPTSTFTPSIKSTASTDIGSVIPTSLPPATSTFTPSIKPTTSIPTSTPLSTSTAPTSVTIVSTTDPVTSNGLTTIVGVLVGVIIALILIILIGVVAVALCYKNRNNLKNGEYNVQNLQGAIVESGTHSQQQELNSYNSDLKIEQFDGQNDNYDDVVHESSIPGYAEINIDEQLYSEVRETVKTNEETTEDNHTDAAEENYYADIQDGGQALLSLQASKLHSYTLLTPKEPPPVPKKSPELYRDLKLEAEDAQAETGFTEQSFNVTPPVVVCNENGTVIDSVYSEIGSDGENLGDGVDLSASGHSGLALLSKPVLNMNSNPDYESPETAMSDTGSYTDEIYTDPDTVPLSASGVEADEIYTNPDAVPLSASGVEADEIYTNPDAVPLSASGKEAGEGEIYTNPDAVPLSAFGMGPSTDEIYTNPDMDSDSDNIYTNPDTTNPGQLVPAIYDTVYCESSVASIFDPDSIPPLYENTVRDDELFPYAPIYTLVSAPEIPPLKLTVDNIRPLKMLGAGYFGQVVLADTVDLSLKDLKLSETDDDKTKSIQVAVKKLKPTASRSTRESFDKEYKFMSRLNHPNVISFLGVCTEDTPYIMMEYLEKGDLNQYLQRFESVVDREPEQQQEVSVKILVRMCTQISDAMKYLASHNYIHRDLAARNCLVGDSNIVKISDFGMSRSLYQSHYYLIKGRAVLPVRWMSTECFYGKFSVNSDVWAFGVTMWEIFTLAQLPFEGMSDKEVADDAQKRDNRTLLQKPDSCPLEVYDIMLQCWMFVPKQRATFDKLFEELSSLTGIDGDDSV